MDPGSGPPNLTEGDTLRSEVLSSGTTESPTVSSKGVPVGTAVSVSVKRRSRPFQGCGTSSTQGD